MECAPRQGAVGRARPGLPELESRSGGRKGTGRRAGPACRPVRERGRRLGRAGEKFWAGGGVWAAGKEGKERKREVGWAKNDREVERGFSFFFNKEIQTIQFKFKFKRIQIQIGQQTIKQCISA